MAHQDNNKSRSQKSTSASFPFVNTEEFHLLSTCSAICHACSKMCLEEGQKRTSLICTECAALCNFALKCHARDSEFTNQIMELCNQACKKCANECSKAQSQHCQECAIICKKCAEVCTPVYA